MVDRSLYIFITSEFKTALPQRQTATSRWYPSLESWQVGLRVQQLLGLWQIYQTIELYIYIIIKKKIYINHHNHFTDKRLMDGSWYFTNGLLRFVSTYLYISRHIAPSPSFLTCKTLNLAFENFTIRGVPLFDQAPIRFMSEMIFLMDLFGKDHVKSW